MKNSVDQDQLASSEASWSGSTLSSKDGKEFWKSYMHIVLYRSNMVIHFIGENITFNSIAFWVIYSCFFVVCWLFSKSTFSKNSFRNTIRVSNSLDPDLGPNCLQRLSADDTRINCFPANYDNGCLHSLLLMCYGGLNCKQYGPKSDCSISLIRVQSVCFHDED